MPCVAQLCVSFRNWAGGGPQAPGNTKKPAALSIRCPFADRLMCAPHLFPCPLFAAVCCRQRRGCGVKLCSSAAAQSAGGGGWLAGERSIVCWRHAVSSLSVSLAPLASGAHSGREKNALWQLVQCRVGGGSCNSSCMRNEHARRMQTLICDQLQNTSSSLLNACVQHPLYHSQHALVSRARQHT